MTAGPSKLPDPPDSSRFRATLADLDKVRVRPEDQVTSQDSGEVAAPDHVDEQTWVLRYAGG